MNINLTDIEQIRGLLARHGFRFSKSMGQNFLCAGWVPERIADEAQLDETTGVLEIGPGIGCLTRQLSERARRVLSVELDRSLAPVLGETLAGCENVQVVFADILKEHIPQLVARDLTDCSRLAVCANLPYNITSPALTAFIEAGCFETITVMIQREVAQRICSREGTAQYGAFSVFVQWHCQAQLLFDVPPNCFIPAPKVTSSVIRLTRRKTPPVEVQNERSMFALVRAAFNQRRKTLVNAASNGMEGVSKEKMETALRTCGFDVRVRGEVLSLADFAALSDALNEE